MNTYCTDWIHITEHGRKLSALCLTLSIPLGLRCCADSWQSFKEWRDHEPELGQGMLAEPLKNTQQQRHWTPFQLEGFAFSTSSGHILQHRSLEAGFIGNHVFHVAHDMPGNCTLQIFPQGPSIPWNWTIQSPVKKLLLSEAFVCTLCWADCLTAQ